MFDSYSTTRIFVTAIVVLICVIVDAECASGQSNVDQSNDRPKVTISKETTWFTEPLNEHGEVDFWEAATRHFSKGVTPEKNIVTAIAQTVRAYEWKEQPNVRIRAYDLLGIEWMVPFDQLMDSREGYAYDVLGDEEVYADESEIWYDLTDYPWSMERYLFTAEWINRSEWPVEWFVSQLDSKSQFYNPLFAYDNSHELSLRIYNPGMDAHGIGEYLICRSMGRLYEGDVTGCQVDLIATRKLARILLKSENYFGIWNGLGLLKQVVNAEVHMVLNKKTTVQHLESYRAEIAALNLEFDVSRFIDQNQRPFVLSSAITAKNGDTFLFVYEHPISTWTFRSVRRIVDWDIVLKRINEHHDMLCRETKSKPVLEQYKAITEYVDNLESSLEQKEKWQLTLELLMSNQDKKSRMLADMIVCASEEFNCDEDIGVWLVAKTCDQLSRLNLELHYFYKQHGHFPDSLQELVPRYLPALPMDPCSGQPFKYKYDGIHFVLYSIGIDGEDDDAESPDGDSRLGFYADDYSITSNPDLWNKQYSDLDE